MLIVVAVMVISSAVAQPCVYTLAGHVEDTHTEEKLAAATVWLKELNLYLVTDANGDFVFTQLCAGTYTLVVSHVDCETVEKTVTLKKDVHTDIHLPHQKNVLKEVTVESVTGTPNTGFKQELSGRKLSETMGLSLSEALGKINGVTLLQTGSNISKPVIHGLHSNRILTINNGVRQEGQQWGNEHAPEIDPFIANRLTVIKGVDALKYGSDAIAGVILVEPKALKNTAGYTAEINTGYFTNNRQYVTAAVMEGQLKKLTALRFRLQGTFKKGANITTPGYRVNNTGNEEINFSVTAAYRKEKFSTELFYSQFDNKVGIFTGAHIGNLTDLLQAIAAPKPDAVYLGQNTYSLQRPRQEVIHRLLKSKTTIQAGEHRFNVLLSTQYNNRKEYDIVRNSSNTRPQMELDILTLAQDITWEHPKKNHFSGVAGLNAMQQDNSYSGRYFIPHYTSYSYGAYYIEKWEDHNWELQAGMRYDNKQINTERLRYGGDTINYRFRFNTTAASFNIGYRPTNAWRFNINTSLASRAPHVNELLSDGIHHGTATYELGNIFLRPERSFNLTTGVAYRNSSNTFSAELTLYRNSIQHFIYQQPLPDSPVLTIAGAFPKVVYRQTNALLKGADASVLYRPIQALEVSLKGSMLRARNTLADDWLIWMPADRYTGEITWHFKDKNIFSNSYAGIEVQHVLRQSRVPTDGNNSKQDYKAPPPAYTLLALNASTSLMIGRQPVVVAVSVRNLLNSTYRDYLNSFRYFADEAGRNIGLRIKIPFVYQH